MAKKKEHILVIVESPAKSKTIMALSNSMTLTTNKIQKELQIENAICLDILAGCSGYINALDIARMYLAIGKVEKALIIGVDKLSEYTKKEDSIYNMSPINKNPSSFILCFNSQGILDSKQKSVSL